MTVVFWVVMLVWSCRWLAKHNLSFWVEGGGDPFLQNVDNHIQEQMVSQPRRLQLITSLL